MWGRGRDLNPGAGLHRYDKTPTVSYHLPLSEGLVEGFADFLRVDLRLSEVTVKEHLFEVKRFLEWFRDSGFRNVSREVVREYLKRFDGCSAYTYSNVLKALRRFFRDYLEMPMVVESFRLPRKPFKLKKVPTKDDLRRFYEALERPIERALFLMYATTGLRKREVLGLKISDVDFNKRMVMPNHDSTTKRSYVTFYNDEAEKALKEYLTSRHDGSIKLFRISGKTFLKFWKRAQLKTGLRLTPQKLREWFCSEMARLGVSDSYIDAFCGRVPRSVLARHYLDLSIERLKEVYDKACLKVLS
ncbi:MAG: tyrosine-type recombinase/integrase [Candidatus Bathyarchaeia archaeon]